MLSERQLLDAVVRFVFEKEHRRPAAREVAGMFNQGLASKSYPSAEPIGSYCVRVGSVTYEIPTDVPSLPRL